MNKKLIGLILGTAVLTLLGASFASAATFPLYETEVGVGPRTIYLDDYTDPSSIDVAGLDDPQSIDVAGTDDPRSLEVGNSSDSKDPSELNDR